VGTNPYHKNSIGHPLTTKLWENVRPTGATYLPKTTMVELTDMAQTKGKKSKIG
jgi:hypothetical protein